VGRQGTSGRNQYYGPGLQNWNFSTAKLFPLRTERVHLRFQVDFFNLFNHTNFSNPVGSESSVNFGKITSTLGSGTATAVGTTAGVVGGDRVLSRAPCAWYSDSETRPAHARMMKAQCLVNALGGEVKEDFASPLSRVRDGVAPTYWARPTYRARGRKPRTLGLLRVLFQLPRKLADAGASPIPELQLIEAQHSTEEGPFYDVHFVPKHRQTRPRYSFDV
jgi:hypothetical protein